MTWLWTDDDAMCRSTPSLGWRGSGGVCQRAEVETSVEERRPTFLQAVIRAVRVIRHP